MYTHLDHLKLTNRRKLLTVGMIKDSGKTIYCFNSVSLFCVIAQNDLNNVKLKSHRSDLS